MVASLVAMSAVLAAMVASLAAMSASLVAMVASLVAMSAVLAAMVASLAAMSASLVAMVASLVAMSAVLVAMVASLAAMSAVLVAMVASFVAMSAAWATKVTALASTAAFLVAISAFLAAIAACCGADPQVARCVFLGWSSAISTQMYSTFALVLSMERTWSPAVHGPEFPSTMIVNDLELSNVLVLLHDLKKLHDHFGARADEHRTLSTLLSVGNILESIVEYRHAHHGSER